LEGIVSKRADAPYAPGNRGLWLKVKCLNREEFVVVGWTDPEGARPWLGALLLAYYDPDGRLIYAGRAGTGIDHPELERLSRRLRSQSRQRAWLLARNVHGPCDKRQPPLVAEHSLLILPPPVAAARRRCLVPSFLSALSRFEAAVRQAFPIDGEPGAAGKALI